MKRELKFRVWDILRNEFIYSEGCKGHYVITLDGKFTNLQNGSGGDEYVIQQYTGLKDSNWKKVFEGDIIEFEGVFEREREIKKLRSSIEFLDGSFGFYQWGFNDIFVELTDRNTEIEVIGNIFENPELLEK